MGDTDQSLDATKKAEQILSDLTITERLAALDPFIDDALNLGDEKEVRRLAEEARIMVLDEGALREKGLEDAENAFSQAVAAGDQEEIGRTDQEVKAWKESLKGFDDFIAHIDQHYDELLANMHPVQQQSTGAVPEQPNESLEEQLEMLKKAREEFDTNIEQIVASIAEEKKNAEIQRLKDSVKDNTALL